MTILKEKVKFSISAALVVVFFGFGCGKGGPGDQKAPDAAVWYDAGEDDDAEPVTDAAPDDGEVAEDGDVTGVQTIDATTLRHEEIPFVMGQTYVDLRGGEEYVRAHIPKADSLPREFLWDGDGLVDGGSALSLIAPVTDLPLFFYDGVSETGVTEELAEAVMTMGYTDVYILEGGIESWRALGFYEDINTPGVYQFHYDPIPENHYIVDNMPEADYTELHITGALNVDTDLVYVDGEFVNDGQVLLDAIPCTAETIIFYCINPGCAASEKASEAAEKLSCYDNTQILHYPEGLEGWQDMGYPTSCGTEPDGPCR